MRISRLLLPLLGVLTLAACDGLGTGPSSDQSRVTVLLTDAPGDFHAAVVTITDVYLQPGEDEGENAERVYLRRDNPVTTDLLTLVNDVLTLVEDQEVPAGDYRQLRFVISGGYIEVENESGGTTIYATSDDYEGLPSGAQVDGRLMMPSMAQSGLKVTLTTPEGEEQESITLTGDQTLLVDFDVSRSFGRAAGQSGRWVMHPVIKATRVSAAAGLTVSVSAASGLTFPSIDGDQLGLGSFALTLTPAEGGDPRAVTLTDADNDGVYEARFQYLFPGEYTVGVTGPGGVTVQMDPVLPFTVALDPGETEAAALTLTAITID